MYIHIVYTSDVQLSCVHGWRRCLDRFAGLCLAIILHVCKINDLGATLRRAHLAKILRCLRAFDTCSAGFFWAFAVGQASCLRISPCANNYWRFTPNGHAHGWSSLWSIA